MIVPIVEELGEFEGFDKEAVTGAKDPDTEQEFAVAVIKVKYEKRKAQFTISFDNNTAMPPKIKLPARQQTIRIFKVYNLKIFLECQLASQVDKILLKC